jgi:O-antigen/teichoic acid export membrane protein
MIRTTLYLGTANFSVALLSLVRNVLVARLISVDDFGIASTFAIVVAFMEMTSNIALDRLIVQARDGEAPFFQATLQAVQAARGALGATILFLIAGQLAALFGIPEVKFAYQTLAVIPLLRGLAHLDMFRLQRNMRFLPFVTVEFSAQFCCTVAAVVLALKFGDYRAMLYALLLQQVVYTATSYVVAKRAYCWAWDRSIVRRIVTFGWPLLINGLLMFGIFQGERIIIGSLIGMSTLGWFSTAFNLTLVAASILGTTLQSLFLPQLAQVQDDKSRFEQLYLVTVQAMLIVGVILTVGFALVGGPIFIGLYGEKYAAALPLLTVLAALQATRLARTGPSIVAMAKAETSNPLIANLLRVLALPIGWFAVANGAGVGTLVAIGLLGEAAALIFGLLLLKWRLYLPVGRLLASIVTFGLAVGLALVLAAVPWYPFLSNSLGTVIPQLLLVALPLFVLSAMPALRHWVQAYF